MTMIAQRILIPTGCSADAYGAYTTPGGAVLILPLSQDTWTDASGRAHALTCTKRTHCPDPTISAMDLMTYHRMPPTPIRSWLTHPPQPERDGINQLWMKQYSTTSWLHELFMDNEHLVLVPEDIQYDAITTGDTPRIVYPFLRYGWSDHTHATHIMPMMLAIYNSIMQYIATHPMDDGYTIMVHQHTVMLCPANGHAYPILRITTPPPSIKGLTVSAKRAGDSPVHHVPWTDAAIHILTFDPILEAYTPTKMHGVHNTEHVDGITETAPNAHDQDIMEAWANAIQPWD